MRSSGITALATNSDAPITVLAAHPERMESFILVVEGTFGGFLSLDGGATWGRIPNPSAGNPFTMLLPNASIENQAVMIKRVPASGQDVTGIYAWGK